MQGGRQVGRHDQGRVAQLVFNKFNLLNLLVNGHIYLFIRVCPTKNEPQQQGISYMERQRRGRERAGGRVTWQAYLRLG